MWDAEELARALGAKRSGRQWVCRCVVHEDRNPSMIIFDGHSGVQVRCLAGCEPLEIIEVLKDRGLWPRHHGNDAIELPDDGTRRRPRRPPSSEHEQAAATALALRIFGEAVPLSDAPLARRYLVDYRALMIPADGLACARFHPACPRAGGSGPAIVVRMEDLRSTKLLAIQRIFLLERDGKVVKDVAMMLGPAGGAAMKLSSHHATFWDELSYAPTLNICEGFETGLALIRDGVSPVWALGSAGAIARMPVLFGVGSIVVWADHDRSRFNRAAKLVNVGLDAGTECCERWADAERGARLRWRREEGKDYADA